MPKDTATPSTKKARFTSSIFTKTVKSMRKKLCWDGFNIERGSRFRASALNARLSEASDTLSALSISHDAAGGKASNEPISAVFSTFQLVEALPRVEPNAANTAPTPKVSDIIRQAVEEAPCDASDRTDATADAVTVSEAASPRTECAASPNTDKAAVLTPLAIENRLPSIADLLAGSLPVDRTSSTQIIKVAEDESAAHVTLPPCAELTKGLDSEEQDPYHDSAYGNIGLTGPPTASDSASNDPAAIFRDIEAPIEEALNVLSLNSGSVQLDRRAMRHARRHNTSIFGDIPAGILATEQKALEAFDTFQDAGGAVRNRACHRHRRQRAGPGYQLPSAQRPRAQVQKTKFLDVVLNDVDQPVRTSLSNRTNKPGSSLGKLARYTISRAVKAPAKESVQFSHNYVPVGPLYIPDIGYPAMTVSCNHNRSPLHAVQTFSYHSDDAMDCSL